MIRFVVHLTAILALLLAGALVIVRAQPYDDGGLSAFLRSAQCAPPCFLGIRPGVTTREQAVRILQASPWVERVDDRQESTRVTWTWNGSQPFFLRSGGTENHLLLRDGVVYRIDLLTEANAATFTLLFGTPQHWFYSMWATSASLNLASVLYFEQRAVYESGDLEVTAGNPCPLTRHDQWALLTQISMPALPDHSGYRVAARSLPVGCR